MMNSAIQRLASSGGIADFSGSGVKNEDKGGDFGQMLVNALEGVNSTQADSKAIQQDFLSGRKEVDLHEVMIAQEKASTTMQLTMAVRNKALEAFQEINRLPV